MNTESKSVDTQILECPYCGWPQNKIISYRETYAQETLRHCLVKEFSLKVDTTRFVWIYLSEKAIIEKEK